MIELLDFDLPLAANPTFAVPVSAEPQAIWLETKAMKGPLSVSRRHSYDSVGAWAAGNPATQWGGGFMHTDLSVSVNPHTITAQDKILRLVDNSAAELDVSVAAVSSSQITLNVAGSLIADTVRVIGFAASGFQNANAQVKVFSQYPLVFDGAGFQPDAVLWNAFGAAPDNVLVVSQNSAYTGIGFASPSAHGTIGAFNHTTPADIRIGLHNALSLWMVHNTGELQQLLTEFLADGCQLQRQTSSTSTSSRYSPACLMLQGANISIQQKTLPAVAGTETINFPFDPELMIIAGSSNTAANVIEGPTTAYENRARLFAVPGDPPTAVFHSTGSEGLSRQKHRLSEGTEYRFMKAGSTPTGATQEGRIAINSFQGNSAEFAFSKDGTGNPTAQFPYIVVGLGVAGALPAGASHHPFGRGPWV